MLWMYSNPVFEMLKILNMIVQYYCTFINKINNSMYNV